MKNYKGISTYFICLAIIALSLAVNIANFTKAEQTLAVPPSGKCVILDAGHGAPDGGAVGISGVLEKDINLKITKKLQRLLEQSGTYVIMTRTDDNNTAPDNKGKIRDIKRADLKARREYKNTPNADIFVSIHMNKFPEQKYKGAQVFYARSPQNSKILGETVQKSFTENLDTSNTRVAKTADNSIYNLKDSKIPSIIAECGFLSNPEEEKLLKSDEYQNKIAWAIYLGINDYFENAKGTE